MSAPRRTRTDPLREPGHRPHARLQRRRDEGKTADRGMPQEAAGQGAVRRRSCWSTSWTGCCCCGVTGSRRRIGGAGNCRAAWSMRMRSHCRRGGARGREHRQHHPPPGRWHGGADRSRRIRRPPCPVRGTGGTTSGCPTRRCPPPSGNPRQRAPEDEHGPPTVNRYSEAYSKLSKMILADPPDLQVRELSILIKNSFE